MSDAGVGRAYQQTNGWTYWRYHRPHGTLVVLDALRREPFERKVVNLADARAGGA